MTSPLPEGWAWAPLPDLGELNRGKSRHRPRDAEHLYGGAFPFVQTGDIARSGGLISSHQQTYSEAGLAQSRLWPKKTVCITIAANIADSAILTYEACFPDSVVGFIALPYACLPEFVEFFIRTARHNLSRFAPATAQRNINLATLRELMVPLPPLAEQQRVVAKVEALLARVNAARQRLAKVPAILKRFRQSVLAAACSGHLTADWREKQRIPSRADGELPASWKQRRLSEICIAFEYGTSQKSEKQGKVPVLRMGNIQAGEVDWSDLVFSNDHEEIKKYSLVANTVLFNRTNSPELVGKTGIYRGERPAIFAGYLIRIIPGPELDPSFLNFSLNTLIFKEFCVNVRTDGVSQSNINAKKLAGYVMNWCPGLEQREIVSQVEALFRLADAIEKRVAAAIARVEKLTQAVLAKAFRGELVPTEADLSRGEGRDYEPASELLDRVRAERVQRPDSQRRMTEARNLRRSRRLKDQQQ
jgi:type I restriction enzyme S subunit